MNVSCLTDSEQATRSRMLSTTAGLLQAQGYHGTGLNQILAVAKAPRGSMYHHFPGGKEQLAIESLQKSRAWVTRGVHAAIEHGGTDARAGLRVFVEAFARQLEESDFAQGCPIATVALESSTLTDPLRGACADAYAEWQALFAERLAAIEPDRRRADALATLVLAAIEGALVLSKCRRDATPLRLVGKQLDAVLAARVAEPVRRRANPRRRRKP